MSKQTAPQTTGGHTVTFSNYILQLGQRCNYTDFIPLPLMRDYFQPFANVGSHELETWLLGVPLSLQLQSPEGSYQYAFLLHGRQVVVAMHAGFDASGAELAWGAAHALNQHVIRGLYSAAPKEAADHLAQFMQPSAELIAPAGPAMVASLLPAAVEESKIHLPSLEDFTRQLFWALHFRYTVSVNGSA
jgi:hypothetical protein